MDNYEKEMLVIKLYFIDICCFGNPNVGNVPTVGNPATELENTEGLTYKKYTKGIILV